MCQTKLYLIVQGEITAVIKEMLHTSWIFLSKMFLYAVSKSTIKEHVAFLDKYINKYQDKNL